MNEFIQPDDHILIMDMYSNFLTLDELHALEDVGIKTTYLWSAVCWPDMQSHEGAPINWKFLDTYMEKIGHTGLKVLAPFIQQLPYWKPDDWYFSQDGPKIPSYTNPQTADELDTFARKIIERYMGSNFQLIYSIPKEGEFPYVVFPTPQYDPLPHKVLTDFIVARQRIFEAQFGEIWTFYHWSGNPPYMDSIYTALNEAYPDSKHCAVQFTHFPPHPSIIQFSMVKRARELYGLRYFVGSEYCTGMAKYIDSAIAQGVGFLTAPLHYFQDEKRLTPEMIDIIKNSVRKMEAARVIVPTGYKNDSFTVSEVCGA